MVTRTWGVFPLHQGVHTGVNGDTIPGLHADTLGALAGDPDGDGKRVATQLSGDVTSA